MSDELAILAHTILFTALMWLPYVLNQIAVRGLINAVGYQSNPAPLADWAVLLKAAHYNAVENLVIFAPLILMIEMLDIGNIATSMSAMVYLIARIVHAISYTFAIPFVRTGAFAVSWLSILCLIWQLMAVA